jgi:pectate lyase
LGALSPYVTIDGRTADNLNITVIGHQTQVLDTHDIIIRYMRFRVTPGTGTANWRSLLIGSSGAATVTYNVIVDHCSIERSTDDDLNIWENAHHITIQWCYIGNGTNIDCSPNCSYFSSTCPIDTGACPDSVRACLVGGVFAPNNNEYLTMCYNLFGEAGDRSPKLGARGRIEFYNNSIMNSVYMLRLTSTPNGCLCSQSGCVCDSPKINIIKNYFQYPSNSHGPCDPIYAYQTGYSELGTTSSIHVSGNYYNGGIPTNQWDLTGDAGVSGCTQNLPTSLKKNNAWNVGPCYSYTPEDPTVAKDRILSEGGCRGNDGTLDAIDVDFHDRCISGVACIPPLHGVCNTP